MKPEAFRQNKAKFIQSDKVITMQRMNSSCLSPFQHNCGFGAVHSADEKRLSGNTNIVGIAKYSIANRGKTSNCVAVACVRIAAYL